MKAASGGGGVLPAGYTQLTRLISDKHQTVSTGLTPSFASGTHFKFVFQVLDLSGTQIYFGTEGYAPATAYAFQLPLVSSTLRADRVRNNNNFGTATLNGIYTYEEINDSVTCNNVTYNGLLYSNTKTLWFFGQKNGNTMAAASFFEASYEDGNGDIIMNLVPALRDNDSKPGLYDTARNVFLTNSTSNHEFGYETLGGIVVNPS